MNDDIMHHLDHAACWATKAHIAYEEGKYEASNTAAHISEAYSRIASVITNRAAAAANTQSVDDVNAQATSEINHAVNGTDHTDPARTIIQDMKATFHQWGERHASLAAKVHYSDEDRRKWRAQAMIAKRAELQAEYALIQLDNTDLKSH